MVTDAAILAPLGQFTPEGVLSAGYGDHFVFFAGRDDIHGILMYLLHGEALGYVSNEYGFVDKEINDAILALFKIPSIFVQVTLDATQEAGPHERALIEADMQQDPVDFNNSFAIGRSATGDISHSKARVYMGQGLWCEGSVNLSTAGEGTGVSLRADVANPKGFHAQNNTLIVSCNPVGLTRLLTRLNVEHAIAKAQMQKRAACAAPTMPTVPLASTISAN